MPAKKVLKKATEKLVEKIVEDHTSYKIVQGFIDKGHEFIETPTRKVRLDKLNDNQLINLMGEKFFNFL